MPHLFTRESFLSARPPKSRPCTLFLLLFCLFLPGIAQSDTTAVEARQCLQIELVNGETVSFQVELADDARARQQGLMHRRHLADNAGMLFDYHESVSVQMWMKNTLIALDMLFIDATGQIVHIVENARPRSLEIIESTRPVRAVLEVNAGTVAQHGVRIGDRIRHAIFDSDGK